MEAAAAAAAIAEQATITRITTTSLPEEDDDKKKKKKQVYILAGQSNMAGRGGVINRYWDGFVPPESQPNPSILRFSAGSLWEVACEPLHADIDAAKVCGIGPGMIFATALLAHLSEAKEEEDALIGLVPCAIGGTAIKEWEKGARLYEEMVRRAREAVVAGGGEIKAFLWYQGESDTDSDHAANAYRENMERLIRDVRCDLCSPSLPFIEVAISTGNKHWIEKVRKAQLGIHHPNVVCVDSKGLPVNEDHLHLTTKAQVLLGKMLAEAYIKHFLTPFGS